jgi:hypothetical protein
MDQSPWVAQAGLLGKDLPKVAKYDTRHCLALSIFRTFFERAPIERLKLSFAQILDFPFKISVGIVLFGNYRLAQSPFGSPVNQHERL